MSRKLLTAEDFAAWNRANLALLQDEMDTNQARVTDEVIRQCMRLMGERRTLNEAGDKLLKFRSFNTGKTTFTPAGIREALLAIGWVPPAKRKGGAHE